MKQGNIHKSISASRHHNNYNAADEDDYDDESPLPESLWIEILIKLPTDAIFRCKCVCERWFSLISQPFFARIYVSQDKFKNENAAMPWTMLHYLGSKRGTALRNPLHQITLRRLYSANGGFQGTSVMFAPPLIEQIIPVDSTFLIHSSSDGLVLCELPDNHANSTSIYYVCNPITRQWVLLPPLVCSKIICAGLITQVEGGIVLRYKVVCIDLLRNHDWNNVPKATTLHIFCSEIGEWRKSKMQFPSEIVHHRRNPIIFNGYSHWFTHKGFLAFNPYKSSNFRLIRFPYEANSFNSVRCTVNNGHLIYLDLCNSGSYALLKLWALEDYEVGRWELKHEIKWNEIRHSYLLACKNEHILRRFEEFQDLDLDMSFMVLALDPIDIDIVYIKCFHNYASHGIGGFISYNFKTGMVEVLDESQLLIGDYHNFNDCQLFSTFVMPPWPTPVPLYPYWKTFQITTTGFWTSSQYATPHDWLRADLFM